jgi:hypothetical protein
MQAYKTVCGSGADTFCPRIKESRDDSISREEFDRAADAVFAFAKDCRRERVDKYDAYGECKRMLACRIGGADFSAEGQRRYVAFIRPNTGCSGIRESLRDSYRDKLTEILQI